MSEHAIETLVTNRSNWNRPSYQRFSYSERTEDRETWPQVWISRADDYTRARELLRSIGIEPVIRHGEELAAARNPTPTIQRRGTVVRVRRIVMIAVLAACAMVVLRYMHIV
ncbi:hypothetical protein HDE80_000605 [Rhodanobacter sp. A1T4]|nr:hypothetical protein [Rhodanobacter sp. MP1X3]MBB6245587.1 hypothetical protein [Rhodanobacter sp. A1T4]